MLRILFVWVLFISASICIAQTDSISYFDEAYYIDDPESITYDNGSYHDTYGYHYGFAMGVGVDDFSIDTTKHLEGVHLETYFGWRFNKRLSLSSGIGFEFNESRFAGFRFDTQFLTLHTRVRYNILTTRYMPFVFGRLGYGFGPPQEESIVDHSNGANYQLGIGLTFPSRKSHKYFIGLAWHHQSAMGAESFIDPLGNEINTKYDILINRIVIKFGMEFR